MVHLWPENGLKRMLYRYFRDFTFVTLSRTRLIHRTTTTAAAAAAAAAHHH